MENIFVGTCGWSYKDDWTGFYPATLKPSQYLQFYSKIFRTVEIDSSFYHIPSQRSVEGWALNTPPDFRFSSKLYRGITHDAKLELSKCEKDLHKYLDHIYPLESHQKCLGHLIQLPPSFTKQQHWENFQSFISHISEWRQSQALPSSHSWNFIVEFRNKSWITPEVFHYLYEKNISYCSVIEPQIPPEFKITGQNLFYLRFHGFGKNPMWRYLFSREEIKSWGLRLREFISQNPKATHVVYFNNHFSGNAIKNAMDLLPELGLKPTTNLQLLQTNNSAKDSDSKIQQKTKKLDSWIR